MIGKVTEREWVMAVTWTVDGHGKRRTREGEGRREKRKEEKGRAERGKGREG